MVENLIHYSNSKSSGGGSYVLSSTTGKIKKKGHPQLESELEHPRKKQRRCWSRELHQRFVDVLLLLGGLEVATPTRIIEVMHVEGLTNDEVKSHLQRHRLHARRVIWMEQDQRGKGKLLEAASPQGALNLILGVSANGNRMAAEKEQSCWWNWNVGYYHQPQAHNYLSL